jgi:predicted GNAT family acetyltransferase
MNMPFDVRHDPSARRFETVVDGQHCELDYRLDGKVMTITHTGVPGPVEGRGIASTMTRVAMETARAEGWRVVPACSYAAAWMRRHPEFADLRA